MSDLVTAQQAFAQMVGHLLNHIYSQGFAVTLDECYRPHDVAQLYQEQGRGIGNSLHTQRLAIDLNLWQGEHLCQVAGEYKPFGDWWTAQHVNNRWGGNFTNTKTGGDYRHFSYTFGGVS